MKNHRMQKYLKKSLALFFAVTVAASTLSAPAFAEEQQSETSNVVVEENQVQESEGAKTSVDKPDNQSDNEAADTNEKAEGRKTEPVTQSVGNGSKAVQTYSGSEVGTSAENAIVVPDDAYIFTGGAIKGISKTWFSRISPNGDVRYLKLVIPAEINGQAVTNISSYALQYKGNGFQHKDSADLKKIKIVSIDFSKASNLEIIKDFAFDQRSEISGTVDLSNTKVTTIGAGAFRETAITNVVLPDKLEALGDVKTNAGSFASCANLESVKYASYKGDRPVAFPDTLVTIGKQCFRYSFSKNMSFAVDIPESVKNIGSEAFNTNNNNGSSRVSTIYVKRTADYSGYDKYAFQNGKSFIVFPSAKAYQEAKNRVSNSKTYTPTYEVQAVFKKSEDNTVVDTQKKLYNQYICYEKNGDDVWRISEDYALPGLEGVALKLGYEIGWYFEKNKESVNSESTVNDESTLPDTINILTDGITISEPKVTVSGADGVCEGSDITLKAEITNKIEGFHYEYVWAKYDKQTNKWIEIEGADKDTFQITEGGKYYLAAVTAYDDEGRESEQGGDYTWVSKRQHHWKYESKDNQITVKCINSGCKYEAEGITSILNAENMEYTGKVYDKASFGTEVADLTGVTADEIQYYEENSDTPLENAPINAGKYKASIKLSNGESAVAAFEITKAKIMPEVTVENWTYGDEENEPVVTGNDGNAEVTYTYYTDEACTQKTTESSGAENEGEMPTQPGKYYVKATVAETDNYQPGEAVTSFTIRKIDAPKFDEIKENEDGEYEIG